MPFKKGQSGNPAGAKKGAERVTSLSARQLRQQAEGYSQEMLDVLVAVARGQKPEEMIRRGEDGPYVELVVKGADLARAADRVLVWAHGNPGTRIDDIGFPENWLTLSLDEQLTWALAHQVKANQLVDELMRRKGAA